jgi:hypothetical protein
MQAARSDARRSVFGHLPGKRRLPLAAQGETISLIS